MWQDYEHHEDTLCFTDLLSMFVGESFGIRVPGLRNEKFTNKAPTLYSGRTPITATRGTEVARDELTRMMAERFTTFNFTVPLPLKHRRPDWPKCVRCASAFYFNGPSAALLAASGA